MRWLLRLIFILLVGVVIFVGALFLLPSEKIAQIAAEQISKATGRDVTLSGETKLSFYPVLGISTGGITIANADWSQKGPFLTADALKIGVTAEALMGGEIHITGLQLQNPVLLLERAKDGRVNWEIGVDGLAPANDTATSAENSLSLSLERAVVKGGTIRFRDYGTGDAYDMEDLDLDLRWPDYQGRATFDAAFRPFDDKVQIKGYLDRVGHFIDGGVSEAEANMTLPGGTMRFAGKATATPRIDGRLNVDFKNTTRALAALGQGGIDIPRGFGQALKLGTNLTFTENFAMSLRDMTLSADQNALSGAADLKLGGAKPRFDIELNAGALDLSALSPQSSGGTGGGTSASSGWSKTPIDASGLAVADGKLALSATSIDLGDLKLGQTQTFMTLDNSRAVFQLKKLVTYGGTVAGEFVMNNRSGLSVGGDLTANGIDLKALFSDAMGVDRLSGAGNGRIKLLGVGQSMHAIINSLKGNGSINTGRGVISGIDLDKLMRSGAVGGGTTVFDSLTASFTMVGGNLQNNDLKMSLPLATSSGKGRIGLGAKDMDYLFTPVLLQGETKKGLAIPIKIRGPWANLKITPDLEKAIDLNFKEEKKELKAKAKKEVKKEVNRALKKELGVEVEEDQSVKDALRKKLEKEAKKELLKLFQ